MDAAKKRELVAAAKAAARIASLEHKLIIRHEDDEDTAPESAAPLADDDRMTSFGGTFTIDR